MLDAISIGDDELVWFCDICQARNNTTISALKAVEDIIALPRCDCGALGFFVRTWEVTPDAPHRRAINSLAEHLSPSVQKPTLLADLSGPLLDISGRKARAEALARSENAEEERLFAMAEAQRASVLA